MLDQILLLPLESQNLFEWTTIKAGEGQSAVRAVAMVVVVGIAAFNIFKHGMSLAKIVSMLFVCGMAHWLIEGNAIQFFGQMMQGLGRS